MAGQSLSKARTEVVYFSQAQPNTQSSLPLPSPFPPPSESSFCLSCMQRLSVAPAKRGYASLWLFSNARKKTNKRKTHFFFSSSTSSFLCAIDLETLSSSFDSQVRVPTRVLLHLFRPPHPHPLVIRHCTAREVKKIYAISIDIARD